MPMTLPPTAAATGSLTRAMSMPIGARAVIANRPSVTTAVFIRNRQLIERKVIAISGAEISA
ncbi:hypothetical protein NRB_25260 [Novosphingobium sp. 11B]